MAGMDVQYQQREIDEDRSINSSLAENSRWQLCLCIIYFIEFLFFDLFYCQIDIIFTYFTYELTVNSRTKYLARNMHKQS